MHEQNFSELQNGKEHHSMKRTTSTNNWANADPKAYLTVKAPPLQSRRAPGG